MYRKYPNWYPFKSLKIIMKHALLEFIYNEDMVSYSYFIDGLRLIVADAHSLANPKNKTNKFIHCNSIFQFDPPASQNPPSIYHRIIPNTIYLIRISIDIDTSNSSPMRTHSCKHFQILTQNIDLSLASGSNELVCGR